MLALQWPRPPRICLQRPHLPCHICLAFHRLQLWFQSSCGDFFTASIISTHKVRNTKVKSSSFSSRENQSLLDPPSSFQKIPDSVPVDVKILLQKFPSIPYTRDVKLTTTHGVEHHIHTGSHPPVFAKSRCLDPEKLQIGKAEIKRLESVGIIRHSKSPWASPLHMVPKKEDRGGLVATIAVKIW